MAGNVTPGNWLCGGPHMFLLISFFALHSSTFITRMIYIWIFPDASFVLLLTLFVVVSVHLSHLWHFIAWPLTFSFAILVHFSIFYFYFYFTFFEVDMIDSISHAISGHATLLYYSFFTHR